MLKGYRTIILNGAVAAATAFMAHFTPETVSEIAGAWAPFALIALSMVNMGLRAVTSTPVGQAK